MSGEISLPKSWELKPLGQVATIVTGRTPPTADRTLYGSEFSFVSPADLGEHKWITRADKMLSASGWSAVNQLPEKSILVSCIGYIGKIGISAIELATNQQINAVIPLKQAHVEYIYYALLHYSPELRAQASEQVLPILNKSSFARFSVPLPPLHEQQAIAAALSDADGVVAGLERVIAKKRLIKQGAMQDLLTARRRLPGFSGEWEVKRLGDHVRFLKNGTHSRAQLSDNGPVKNLHYGDIHGASSIFLAPATSPMPTLEVETAGRLDRLTTGDLVFVDASEDLVGVGTSVEITDVNETEVVSGLHTIAARFDKSVLVDGFKAFLQFMPDFRSHLCQLAAGTKVLATNRGHIASAEIPLPQPNEQQAIAAVLSDMDAEIQTLESRLTKARAVKEGMMQNLLTGRVRLV